MIIIRTYKTPAGTLYKLYLDALDQPHLLIAGATGSGKSVIINGLIYTALHRLPLDRPGGAQGILIDPKRVELVQYSRVPHTIKYASEPAQILGALRLAMSITEDRYKRMQARRLRKYPGGDVYVIIDEFADLMTTDARTVKPIVQRLAQIGRAARVHIILATQTPISKVLPTEIKCNFDARFGLRTRSAQDSRNILDRPGLELLPRYGQTIYRTPAGDTLYNVPYYSDAELQRIVDHWETQQAGPIRRLLDRLTAGKKYDTIKQTNKMEALKMANTYWIRYGTGAGDEEIVGTLDDAKRAADDGAAYTQTDIVIEDDDGNEITRRRWYGVELTEDDMTADEDEYIIFGSFGFFAPWDD